MRRFETESLPELNCMIDRRRPDRAIEWKNGCERLGDRTAVVGVWIAMLVGFVNVLPAHASEPEQVVNATDPTDPAKSTKPAMASENEQDSFPSADQPDAKVAEDESREVIGPDVLGPGAPPPESLEPLIQIARNGKELFETEVDAYTCLLVKRETIEGTLGSAQYLRLKIRERRFKDDKLVQPLSIYGKFLKPAKVAGREVLYVENERDGDLLVRRGGTRLPNLTLELDPDGRLARTDTNYSIKQTGIRPMLEQILDRMESQPDDDQVQIRLFADAKVDGRPCRHIEIRQLKRRANSDYQVAKVYIDDELQLPVYFASYAWSDEDDGAPILQEQYVITKIKLDAELTDLDFDRNNPAYQFKKEDE